MTEFFAVMVIFRKCLLWTLLRLHWWISVVMLWTEFNVNAQDQLSLMSMPSSQFSCSRHKKIIYEIWRQSRDSSSGENLALDNDIRHLFLSKVWISSFFVRLHKAFKSGNLLFLYNEKRLSYYTKGLSYFWIIRKMFTNLVLYSCQTPGVLALYNY